MIEINLKSRTHKIQVRHLTKNVKLQHIGQRGPTGSDGTAATIQVGTVTTVPNTDPATITNVGTTSAAVFDFEIPEGEQGNQGIPGVVQSIVAGTNVTVDDTDPANPVVSASGGGGGGAVDSINGQTGVVVLDTDDIADTATNRFTNDTDITRLANTSGTNTGDQTLSSLGGVPTSRTINGQDLSANRTFTQDNIGDGTTYKQYSAIEKTKLSGIETGADVTDATNVAAAGAFMKATDDTDDITEGATNKWFTAAEESKLAGIEAGAEVNNISDVNATDLTDGGVTTLHSHTVTKSDVGLGNVDNTSDLNKPISTATQTALDGKVSDTGDTITGDVVITESSSSATNTNLSLENSSPTATSPVGINMRNSVGLVNMARIQANPGSSYTNSNLKIEVADSSKSLQTRMNIDVAGVVTVPTAQGSATNTVVITNHTQTLTGKTIIATTNVTEEMTSTASSATPTPTGGSLRNAFDVTALATAAAFQAPSGTPAHRNKLWITIKDDGTARALTWDSVYVAGGVALPTTTVLGKILNLGFIYNTNNSLNKWQLVASAQEA